jgi:hypothetical protein
MHYSIVEIVDCYDRALINALITKEEDTWVINILRTTRIRMPHQKIG